MDDFTMQEPQQQSAAVVAYLRQRGLPATAQNMNRAYAALMQGPQAQAATAAPMERAITRSMAPRRPAAATPAQPARGTVTSAVEPVPPGDEPETVHNPIEEAREHPTRGAQVAAGMMPGGRRAGTINGAQPIDEALPAEGMFGGEQPRQANEAGVDQVSLALALATPLLMGLGGAARGPAQTYMGRMPMPPTGRVIDVPPTSVAGPAARTALPGGGGSPPAISGAAPTTPMAPSGGGMAATPQVSGQTVGQTALPRVDGELRRRMIDRNMAASSRNASRTRDERAAGNTSRGRREPITPVPPGEVAPRAQGGAIPLPKPRHRVQAGRSE